MDNLEKVEIENILPSMSIPSFDSIQEWVEEHVFEIVLIICFLALVIYKFGERDVSIAKEYKSFLDNFNDGLNNLFGKFWLSSNMEGNAIKTKVTFEDDYDEVDEEKYAMHI